MDFFDPPTDDFGPRPPIYKKEEPTGIPSVPANYDFAPLTTIRTVFVEQPGEYTGGRTVELAESQRIVLEEEPQIALMSVPVPSSEPSLVRKEPLTWFNSELPHYIPNGADISGGGTTQSLDQVLAVGNNAGAYDIDMNGQQLLSLAAIQTKPGQDFDIVNTTNDVNLAGAQVNLTAGTNVNIIATAMNMGTGKILNVGTPTSNADAANKAYVDATAIANAANWSSYPAKTAVDISGRDLNNVELITGMPANNNPVIINNSYNLGGTLSQHALIVAGGFDTTGVEVKPVSVAIKKEAFYTGAGDEELGSLNYWGLDDVGDEVEYAAIDTFVQDNTKAAGDSKMSFVVSVSGAKKNMLNLDGSANVVNLGTTLDMSGYEMDNVKFINAQSIQANPVIISNPYNLGGLSVNGNAVVISGGENRVDISNNGIGIATLKNITRGIIDTGSGETVGSFTTFGKDTSNNDVPYATIRGVCTNPNVGSTFGRINLGVRQNTTNFVIAQLDASANNMSIQGNSATVLDMNAHKIINLATPTDASGAATKGYVDTLGGTNWASFPATQNVDMSGFSLTNVGGISNVSGTINMTGSDVNLSCTGLTSVLNINSALGTAIVAGGAVDITAGGTTAINSTGNITIGSLGTTSIENFNLSNSVLTKVPATADLQLNNISKIINNSAVIDISSSSVNLNKFNFSLNTLQTPDATRLFLDDVEAVNNDAVGGRIDITAATVAANSFEFSGATLSTGGSNLTLNNIAKINESTPGLFVDSYGTINAVGTGLTDAVGFKTTTLTATSGTAAGFYSDATEATASGSVAAGAYLGGTTANNIDGDAKGVWVQTVLGGATSGTATGVEVSGSMTGATKRGFWEHSASANVVNTFMNNTGIGKDPSGVALDVLGTAKATEVIGTRLGANVSAVNTSLALEIAGRAQFTQATGGPANPVLIFENTSAGADGSYLQFYHNSDTPAVGDRTGVISFQGEDATPAQAEYGRIRNVIRATTAGAQSGMLDFYATNAGTSREYMHLDGSDNDVAINPNANIPGASFKIYDSQGTATNNLLMNADCSNANVMFKNYPQRYIYDISGTYTLVMPAGFNVLRMLAYGAGGGGGSGRLAASTCFGGGAGGGGNGCELWFDRRELFPDASGSLTFHITVGKGGDGGAAQTVSPNNGNNGQAGGQTYVRINSSTGYSLFYQLGGGNGGSGGTNAAGTGGSGVSWSGSAFGSSGRSGASSSITAQPDRNTAATALYGTVYFATGGSGAGGGVNTAGTTAYAGGIYVSPIGQKFFDAQNVNTGGQAGTASNTQNATAGTITTFTAGGLGTAPAVRPLTGQADLYGGGGGSACGAPFSTGGGDGGGSVAGQPGSRGSGGGGGGGSVLVRSGAGGRGSDGFVYLTFW